jgi:uncharacterized membrane protein YhaH (DUF805 family)
MDIRNLLLSFQGRIGRAQYWLGTLAIAAIEWALQWALGVPLLGNTSDLRLRAVIFAVGLILLYPTAAIAVKRLHDRSQPGKYVGPLLAAYGVALLGDLLGYFDDPDHLGFAGWIAIAFVGVIGLAFLIELGFRRGTPGANQYGPDPRGLRV